MSASEEDDLSLEPHLPLFLYSAVLSSRIIFYPISLCDDPLTLHSIICIMMSYESFTCMNIHLRDRLRAPKRREDHAKRSISQAKLPE